MEVELEDSVARIFLNRPEKANALNSAMLSALAGALESLDLETLRVVVPVVAKLHGAVIGAGLEIAAACDLRVAAEGAKFSMPEVRLGIPSVVEAALLPRLMGSGRAAWLVLTGEAIDARRALEWGLVEEVAPDVDLALEKLVKSLMAGAPAALREQKRLLQLWDEAPLATAVAASIESFRRTTISSTDRSKGN